MAHYQVYKDRAGYWRWRYVAANNKIIADSAESYISKDSCLAGIGIMKASSHSPVYEV